MEDRIMELARRLGEQAAAWRHQLHRRPELSFQEEETSALVAETLEGLGYTVRRKVGRLGVVAVLDTGRPGPVIGFRADMDALPIQENTGLPYASERPGVMHACGHDIHTAVLLGTAAMLMELREELRGTIKLIFQPGEEALDGACGMIRDGALRDPAVEAMFALHVFPDVPAGSIALREGFFTATDDELYIKVTGASAHSSTPQDGVNALTIAAHILTAMDTITSSAVSPFEVSTCSICKLRGGEKNNVIPDLAEMWGMVRCLDKKTKALYRKRITDICSHTAQALGGQAEVEFTAGFPAVCNDPALTQTVLQAARGALGEDRVRIMPRPNLGSEDFAFFQEEVPGVMYSLGCAPAEGCGNLHTGEFCPDESCIPVGMAVHTAVALAMCGRA